MTSGAAREDLVVLVPCGNMEFAVKGLLLRTRSLGIREVSCRFLKHPGHDPGCRSTGVDLLRGYSRTCQHALLLFDREGCGREDVSREDLEGEIEGRLHRSGWGDRAAVVVLDPELETWVWSDSREVDRILGWQGRHPALRTWLVQQGFQTEGQTKPDRPKTAMTEALRIAGTPQSSALFQKLATEVSFRRCQDPAFLKLTVVLRQWFGVHD